MNGSHEIFMKRCLDLAAMGLGNVAPNPMVGAVVVHEGKIIGEGYHRRYGEAHAEVNAINAVTDKSLLKSATLYVNLEPCAHYGKTPPCSELITKMHIPRVVIGSGDPNPLVNGKGTAILKQAGCDVITGILRDECEELNRRFFTFQQQQRPYIILKWAETADGYIDKIRSSSEKPQWITNEASRMLVHKWRSEEQGIMVGANTALMDNPQLNVRDWKGSDPVRIIIDNDLTLPQHLRLFHGSQKTIVFTLKNSNLVTGNIELVKIPAGVDKISFVFNHLYCNKILSVIVEGGAKLVDLLIERNLWDEARVFQGKALFGGGICAPGLHSTVISETEIDGVRLRYYRNNR